MGDSCEARWLPGLRRSAGSPKRTGSGRGANPVPIGLAEVPSVVADIESAIVEAAGLAKSLWVLGSAFVLGLLAAWGIGVGMVRLIQALAPSYASGWIAAAGGVLICAWPAYALARGSLKLHGFTRVIRCRLMELADAAKRDETVARRVAELIRIGSAPNLAWLSASDNDFSRSLRTGA